MAEIITFGSSEDKKLEHIKKEGILKKIGNLIHSFKSLDKFTRSQIIAIAFVIIATPTIVGGYLILHPKADTFTGDIGTAITYNNPYGSFHIYSSPAPSPFPNYPIDPQALSLFNKMNLARTGAGLPALLADSAMTCVANKKTQDEDNFNYFDHPSPDHNGEDTWGWAFAPCGVYSYTTAGENLGQDSYPPDATDAETNYIYDLFMGSTEHRGNILGTIWKTMGVSRRYDVSRGEWIWAVEFLTDKISPVTYIAQSPSPTPTPTVSPTSTPNQTFTPSPTPIGTPIPTSTPIPTPTPTPKPITYSPATYYCNYGGATGYSYKNVSTGICTNGTYTTFYHSPTCPTSSANLGKSVLIQPCNYIYYSSANCSGSIAGYNVCTSRTVTSN